MKINQLDFSQLKVNFNNPPSPPEGSLHNARLLNCFTLPDSCYQI